jgi:hypothetical protein
MRKHFCGHLHSSLISMVVASCPEDITRVNSGFHAETTFFYKTTYLIEEVNRTYPFPLVSVPY